MTFPLTKDNAQGQLDAGISAGSLSLTLGSGEGALFPSTISGSATSGGDANTLNSTGIQAAGVAVGDLIENLTDGSQAFVVSVSTDSVTTSTLKGGSGNTWDNADEWVVGRFIVTINTRDGDGIIDASEKILVKTRSGDVFTISNRGYDGSSAQVWSTGAYVSLFPVSKHFEDAKAVIAQLASDIKALQDTKATIVYVDALIAGMKFKDVCVAATTANITIATALNNGDTLDGITLATGDRVLVKDQSTASENGIYIVGASPSRATDFDETTEVNQAVVPVKKGTINADTMWLQTTDDPVINTNNLVFTKLPSNTTFTGLTDTPSTYSGQAGKGAFVNDAENALEFQYQGFRSNRFYDFYLSGAGDYEVTGVGSSTITKEKFYSNVSAAYSGVTTSAIMYGNNTYSFNNLFGYSGDFIFDFSASFEINGSSDRGAVGIKNSHGAALEAALGTTTDTEVGILFSVASLYSSIKIEGYYISGGSITKSTITASEAEGTMNKFRIEKIGSTINFYKNGAFVTSLTNSLTSAMKSVGISAYCNNGNAYLSTSGLNLRMMRS